MGSKKVTRNRWRQSNTPLVAMPFTFFFDRLMQGTVIAGGVEMGSEEQGSKKEELRPYVWFGGPGRIFESVSDVEVRQGAAAMLQCYNPHCSLLHNTMSVTVIAFCLTTQHWLCVICVLALGGNCLVGATRVCKRGILPQCCICWRSKPKPKHRCATGCFDCTKPVLAKILGGEVLLVAAYLQRRL